MYAWQREYNFGIVAYDFDKKNVYYIEPSVERQKSIVESFLGISEFERSAGINVMLTSELLYSENVRVIKYYYIIIYYIIILLLIYNI